MLKRVLGVGLLGLCLIMVAIGTLTLTGCLDTQQKEQIKKDSLEIVSLALQYKTCADDAAKAELKTNLQDKAKELAKRYGHAAAELVIKRLKDTGKLKPDIADYLLEKLNTNSKDKKEAEAAKAAKD